MKPKTAVLAILLILMLLFVIVFYSGGTLGAQVTRISGTASGHAQEFEKARNSLLNGLAPCIYSGDIPDDPANCSLIDINVTLSNRGLFDAEYLNITVDGLPGDIAVYELEGDGKDIPAHDDMVTDIKILTRGEPEAVHSVSIQYYVYGISRTIRLKA